MRGLIGTSLAILLFAFGTSGISQAALIVSGSVGGAPDGVVLDNLDWLGLGSGGGISPQSGVGINFFGSAQAVQGSVAGQYAAPFLSGSNGAGFGNPIGTDQPNGADATTYLSSGSTGSQTGSRVEILLPDNGGDGYLYLGLLWGSVDAYNTLSLFDGLDLVGVLTGADVMDSPNGDQGVNGTLYVNILTDLAFDRIVAESSQFAFEIDNIAFNRTAPPGDDVPESVPEPATVFLLGAGLLGLGYARRRGIV